MLDVDIKTEILDFTFNLGERSVYILVAEMQNNRFSVIIREVARDGKCILDVTGDFDNKFKALALAKKYML